MGADKYFMEVDENGKPNGWKYIPTEPLILIFEFLGCKDLGRCCQVCKCWNEVGNISYLWQRRFRVDFSLPSYIGIRSSARSWKEEYERVTDLVPSVEFERINEHTDEVLHVAFSNNGMMFCTCSKDATVKVFNADWPFETVFSDNLGHSSLFGWAYTQYSAFSSSDKQLLVAGRYEKAEGGEIVIYGIFAHEFTLQARIRIQPYDVMGCWLNETHILSSKCHNFALRRQCLSEILLNKSSQGIENLRQSTVSRLFMFANDYMNAVSYLRVVDMTKVMSQVYRSIASGCYEGKIHKMHITAYADHQQFLKQIQKQDSSCLLDQFARFTGNECTSPNLANDEALPNVKGMASQVESVEEVVVNCASKAASPSSDPTKGLFGGSDAEGIMAFPCSPTNTDDESTENTTEDESSRDDTSLKSYKLFAAFTGNELVVSHQIGFKRVSQEECENVRRREIEVMLSHSRTTAQGNAFERPDVKTDRWDHIIDVGGQLVGMVASPCGRYLYASYRKFVREQIPGEWGTPAISSTVTISLYDLISMDELTVFEGPSAKSNVFYLYLSCNSQYLASGSEDNQGYLWDRHYKSLLSTFRHENVVNCVAVNPRDPSMAVSVSDDNVIKIWRSKSFHRLLSGARAKARMRVPSAT